jgi:hypothetical protein
MIPLPSVSLTSKAEPVKTPTKEEMAAHYAKFLDVSPSGFQDLPNPACIAEIARIQVIEDEPVVVNPRDEPYVVRLG